MSMCSRFDLSYALTRPVVIAVPTHLALALQAVEVEDSPEQPEPLDDVAARPSNANRTSDQHNPTRIV